MGVIVSQVALNLHRSERGKWRQDIGSVSEL